MNEKTARVCGKAQGGYEQDQISTETSVLSSYP